ncbi:uncharacterized protein [Onthophagus taurus]|uniref:uncharacterized protein n=1 Tax=Onthophagus taurus TaxID=166361 RepID=UPI000C2047A7|nr:stress response protein NST1-like [Onthophagus taurus]
MRYIKLDESQLTPLFKLSWKTLYRTTRRTLKSKLGATSHHHYHHQQQQHRYPKHMWDFIRKNSDFQEYPTDKIKSIEETRLSNSNFPKTPQKPGNNYTINIYYNDPKKMKKNEIVPKGKDELLHELGGTMEEGQYDETLRQVLLLHLLKEHRSVLERNFKKFLDNDLKDMNPNKVTLLKNYLEEKSTTQQKQLQEKQLQQEPSPEYVLNALRSSTEQKKMAFVREALELCDKIIEESNLEEDETLKTHDASQPVETSGSIKEYQPKLKGEIVDFETNQEIQERNYHFKKLEVEAEDVDENDAFRKIVEEDKKEIKCSKEFETDANLGASKESMTKSAKTPTSSSSSSA